MTPFVVWFEAHACPRREGPFPGRMWGTYHYRLAQCRQNILKLKCLYSCMDGGGLVTKSCLTLASPWTVVCQDPLSMGFSRQGYWSRLPFPSPGDLPDPGIEPRSPALQADSLLTELWRKPLAWIPEPLSPTLPCASLPSGCFSVISSYNKPVI